MRILCWPLARVASACHHLNVSPKSLKTQIALSEQKLERLKKLISINGNSKEELDITSPRSLESAFFEIKPTHVINLAAYTNVEKAELEDLFMRIKG